MVTMEMARVATFGGVLSCPLGPCYDSATLGVTLRGERMFHLPHLARPKNRLMNASKSSQIGEIGPVSTPVYEFGAFRLEPENRLLTRDGQAVALTPKAFDALVLLAERKGKLVTKDELMSALWPGTFVSESNLTQTIFMLRKALGESASEQRFIVTVPGSGYRFAAPLDRRIAKPGEPSLAAATDRNVSLQFNWRAGLLVALTAIVAFIILFRAMAPLPAPRVEQARQAPLSNYADPGQNILSDGARLFFVESIGNQYHLVETSVAGGNPVRLEQPFPGTKILDISADRTEFLIGKFDNRYEPDALYVWPVQGGSPARIGNIYAKDASWTPNGRDIL